MRTDNFQAESKRSGDFFEDLVLDDLKRSNHSNIKRRVIIEEVGVEADFAYVHNGTQVYVEAKGGDQGEGKRPGAKRTDSVKKAIANAALVKSVFPDVKYTIYFSDMPTYGRSAHRMIKSAVRAGFVDNVIYLIPVKFGR